MAKMGKVIHREERDGAILCAIMGVDNISQINMTIEEGYLLRERMENLRESGYEVPEDFQPRERSETERRIFQNFKQMEGLEEERTKRIMEWEEQEPDLEDFIPEPPRMKVEVL